MSTQKHIHCDSIIAWANGEPIQFFNITDEKWEDIVAPGWYAETKYRIKPKNIVKKWRWVYLYTGNVYIITDGYFSEKEAFCSDLFVQKIDETMIEVEE